MIITDIFSEQWFMRLLFWCCNFMWAEFLVKQHGCFWKANSHQTSRVCFRHGRTVASSFPSLYLSIFDPRLKSIRPWRYCVQLDIFIIFLSCDVGILIRQSQGSLNPIWFRVSSQQIEGAKTYVTAQNSVSFYLSVSWFYMWAFWTVNPEIPYLLEDFK